MPSSPLPSVLTSYSSHFCVHKQALAGGVAAAAEKEKEEKEEAGDDISYVCGSDEEVKTKEDKKLEAEFNDVLKQLYSPYLSSFTPERLTVLLRGPNSPSLEKLGSTPRNLGADLDGVKGEEEEAG